jgi:hypothetical protein
VVPGYVKCPKCHKRLPVVRSKTGMTEGGTAVDSGPGFPVGIVVIVAAVLGAGLIFYFGFRGKSGQGPSAKQDAGLVQTSAAVEAAQPSNAAAVEAAQTPAGGGTAAPNPDALANELERALKKQRLWSTVSVSGARIDVRSGSCGDPAMAPAIDARIASFKASGLTHLRCVEQSGRVVFERDL